MTVTSSRHPCLGCEQERQPTDLTFDEQGNVYVADQWNRRVQMFDQSGAFITSFDGSEAGIDPCGQGSGVVALVLYGGNGYLFVVDVNASGSNLRLMKLQITLTTAPNATPTP
jgi:hypothetical protein